ncbi:Ig-like domain-containing protein [Aeromicrobium sp.]|uniref:Ig-like domain-containing protein n=1 Tax=Aeromicrobium sp. TaxID=1871063 RepID=UPI0030C1513D
MPRKSLFLGALTLLLVGLLPALAPASAAPLPALATAAEARDEGRYVDLTVPAPVRSITPDTVTSGQGGQRIEIYGSVGDNEGGMDWRTVNAFAHLVDSVPKGKQSYTTLFNSLFDDRSISYVPDSATPGNGKFTVARLDEVFSPTAAYLNQVNLYETEAERRQFIHVLGAKESIDEAVVANSSLAKLVRAGYKKAGQQAVDYNECAGDGGCLSGSNHLMHSKYGAFEQARDSAGTLRNNVVWITSSNLNGSSGSKKSNISIAIYDDQKAYTAVKDGIFEPSVEVAKGATPSQAIDGSPAYKAAITVDPATGVIKGMPTDSGVTLLPSPRAKTAASDKITQTDVEAAFLKKRVDDPAAKTNCKVYAVHSLFNSTRAGVRDGLADLSREACDVRIVLGDNAISDIVDGYFNMSEDLRELVGRVEFANVHDKTMSYKDSSTATTFGGASNFTGTSLEYDELAFRADNLGVTEAVQTHSERIYQLGRGQTTWATPTSVAVSPTGTLNVKAAGGKLQLSPRVSPDNALVTKTEWTSANPALATVSPDGLVTGLVQSPTPVAITVKVSAPPVVGRQTVTKSKTVNVTVVGPADAATTGAGGRASIAPTLTMDNYQSPGGTTGIVVTWGSGDEDYDGIVKLQYYSSGWRTYTREITVRDGVGRLNASMGSSKTWRAYGARLDRINGKAVPNSTTKATSKWSINTVRTKPASLTPRLYATNLAKIGQKVPFLISWDRGSGVVRLQMRAPGGSWKTHSSYRIPSGGDQEFIAVPVLNTKYWRIATATGSTKISNTVKVSMK